MNRVLRYFTILILPAMLLSSRQPLFGLSGEEIIRAMEKNQVHKTAESTGSMTITDRFGSRKKTFKSYSQGEDKMLLTFTNPEEAGQKILRSEDNIYLYFPEAEEVIHLQGEALKDRVLGSDFSYEDMTGGKGLLDSYTVTLAGTESVDGHSCYRIELVAKRRDVLYPKETLWVDTELMVYRKVVLYSLKGTPIKEMSITDFIKKNGKVIPVYFEMKDLLKKDSKTAFRIDDIKIDTPLDPKLFSLEELSW